MKKYFIIFFVIILSLLTVTLFNFYSKKKNSIIVVDYDLTKHREEIKRIFFENYYWAVYDIPLKDYSFENRFDSLKVEIDEGVYAPLNVKVAMDKDQVAGYITYYKITNELGHIQIVVVDKNHRRKGVGEVLMKAAVNDLISMGNKTVHLITKKDDIPAQNLYKKIGFIYWDRSENEEFKEEKVAGLEPAMDFVYFVK